MGDNETGEKKKRVVVESLGWLTESTIMPKKHRAIAGVGPSSILELKAQLYKSQEEAKSNSTSNKNPDQLEVHRAKKKIVPNDPFSGRNSGVDARSHKDKLEMKAEKDGTASYAALERKAELYEKLVRGELSDEEDKEKYCVDFSSKTFEESHQPQRHNPSPIEANVNESDTNEDHVLPDARTMGLGRAAGTIDNDEHKRFVREVHEEVNQAREKVSELKVRRQEQVAARREKLKQAYLRKQLEKLKGQSTQGSEYMDDETFNTTAFSQMTYPDLDFFVPETQPETLEEPVQPQKRSHKRKKKKGEASGLREPTAPKRKATPWTPDEKLALCRAWIEISEDDKCVDYQRRKVFWAKVREKFYDLVGSRKRNPDMISGRWSEIRKYVGLFTNLHNQNSRRMRPSGSDDLQVYQFTCEEWKADVLRKFGMVKAFDDANLWEELKRCSKWVELVEPDMIEAQKLTKTSSSGAHVTSSGSDGRVDVGLNMFEQETPPLERQPTGRDQEKRTTHDEFDSDFKDLILKISSCIEVVAKVKKDDQRLKNLKFLTRDFSHLSPRDQAIMEKEKDRIRAELEEN